MMYHNYRTPTSKISQLKMRQYYCHVLWSITLCCKLYSNLKSRDINLRRTLKIKIALVYRIPIP
jgi:hypothetical protein